MFNLEDDLLRTFLGELCLDPLDEEAKDFVENWRNVRDNDLVEDDSENEGEARPEQLRQRGHWTEDELGEEIYDGSGNETEDEREEVGENVEEGDDEHELVKENEWR